MGIGNKLPTNLIYADVQFHIPMTHRNNDRYMSVLAPYARLAMIQSVPTVEHCMDVVSPPASKTAGRLEDEIQELLASLYAEGKIVGCQVAVYWHGMKVVDSCAGTMGPCDPRPVKLDTVFK